MIMRSAGLCLQYKGFSPDCVTGTVGSKDAALSATSTRLDSSAGVLVSSRTGATDSDADAGGCACPHAMQKGLPSTILPPQLLQNIGPFLVVSTAWMTTVHVPRPTD